jgi:hypothetical protein
MQTTNLSAGAVLSFKDEPTVPALGRTDARGPRQAHTDHRDGKTPCDGHGLCDECTDVVQDSLNSEVQS